MKRPLGMKFATGLAIAGLLMSSAASAAPTIPRSVDPMVALSLFGTQSSRAAVCAAGAASLAASAAATQAAPAQPGCVLPVVDAAPVVSEEVPPPEPVYAPPAVGGGLSVWPLLLGLAAIAGALVLILKNDDDDEINLPPPVPVSPA